MSDESPKPAAPGADEPSLFDRPQTHKAIHIGLAVACVAAVLSDLLYHKHGHFAFEEAFGFHAFFGFVAYMTIVNSAKLLRRFVKRPENYYGGDDD